MNPWNDFSSFFALLTYLDSPLYNRRIIRGKRIQSWAIIRAKSKVHFLASEWVLVAATKKIQYIHPPQTERVKNVPITFFAVRGLEILFF
mmetsp:Transcript_6037/g.5381  ORF Transcript_6037/g.5381 Transcript_6037/m.5381 type:complete len:90 (+) Transcript_6037:561-830(+)